MKVSSKKPKTRKLAGLCAGQVFIYGGEHYMVLELCGKLANLDVAVVLLKTGEALKLAHRAEVIPINGAFVEE
jgi:hypothetical protein